jgi:hypothetical protein
MKILSRVTNSFVVTAAVLAVIIGSLCFSVGEGLRLTPFPALSQNSDTVIHAGDSAQITVGKYGPVDVPAQKRGKRQVVDLAAVSVARTQPTLKPIVHSIQYEDSLPLRALISAHSGRAPPLHS